MEPTPTNSSEERKRFESALEKTVPASEFGPDGLRQEIESTPAESSAQTPQQFLNKTSSDLIETPTVDRTATVTGFDESSEVLPELAGEEEAGGKRYEVTGRVGSGATSHVYSVLDRSLNRTIAVKFLRRASRGGRGSIRERFLHEARVTAMLEHPNIMPIHDIGMSAHGQVYFTMKNVSGTTIGDAIRAVKEGNRPAGDFQTIDGRVRVFLKVCDALAYAHHSGFVHQDIKPDNIMLGSFGEVLLLDWGSALARIDTGTAAGKAMYGTPAYMSPEQARREQADEVSDVYCLAATMFHALTLRHPTWADKPEEFWEKKRAGVIDPLSDTERKTVPRSLAAVVLKGMSADRRLRYQTVSEFADELKSWQEGRAVRAYHESFRERFVRWYRRNRRFFWVTTAASAVILVAGALLLQEKVQELVTWKRFFTDDFSTYSTTPDLQRNWRAYTASDWWTALPASFTDTGYWCLDSGAIRGSFNNGFADVTFAQPVPGDIRVEWTVTPLVMNLNLNCYIAGETRNDGYTFHVGGMASDPGRAFLTRQRNFQAIDSCVFAKPLELARPCRLRMEKEGKHVRLYKDGRRAIDYADIDDLNGPGHQTFGFEACYYNSLRIDDVTVWYHPLPRKVSPIATADRFFARGYFADALSNYREVAMMYPREDLAATALYKSGLCLARLDSTRSALTVLEQLERDFPHHRLVPLSLYERSRILEAASDTAASYELLRCLGKAYPGHAALRTVLNDLTTRRVRVVREALHAGALTRPSPDTVAWLLKEVDAIRSWCAAFGLSSAGNELISIVAGEIQGTESVDLKTFAQLFPDQRNRIGDYMLSYNLYDAVLNAYADIPRLRVGALMRLGRWKDVLAVRPMQRVEVADALLQLGRFDEVLRLFPDRFTTRAAALYRSGRLEESMRLYPIFAEEGFQLYRRMGRVEQYRTMVRGNEFNIAMSLYGSGQPEQALSVLERTWRSGDLRYFLYVIDALSEMGRYDEAAAAFPRATSTFASNAHAMMRAGKFEQALAFTADRPLVHHNVLCELGMYDSAIALARQKEINSFHIAWQHSDSAGLVGAFPGNRVQTSLALLAVGRYADVARDYADQRPQAARALLFSGQYDTLFARYPDQRDICARALIAAGNAGEAARMYPEFRTEVANHLVDKGEAQRAVLEFADLPAPWSEALVDVGRYADVPFRTGRPGLVRQEYWDIVGRMALREFEHGRARRADSLLQTLAPPDFWWKAQRFSAFLLRPILIGLSGDTVRMRSVCEQIAKQYPTFYAERLHYESLFLAGRIGPDEFLRQPWRLYAGLRLALLEAVLADTRGLREEALRRYRLLLLEPRVVDGDLFVIMDANEVYVHDLFESRFVSTFIRWRVRALSGSQQ